MPGMPYKIKSIVARKLESVNHFHYYLCRQLKGGGLEITMSEMYLKRNEEIALLSSGDLEYELQQLEGLNGTNNTEDIYISIDNASFFTIFCC